MTPSYSTLSSALAKDKQFVDSARLTEGTGLTRSGRRVSKMIDSQPVVGERLFALGCTPDIVMRSASRVLASAINDGLLNDPDSVFELSLRIAETFTELENEAEP